MWLCTDHLDALINMLVYKQRLDPDMFLSGWTCIEQYGWVTTSDENFEQRLDVLRPYVVGTLPKEGGLALFANLSNTHWVAVKILMEEQKLVIYNSISTSINWKKLPKLFLTATRFIPWLCERLDVWEKRNTSSPLRKIWEVVEYPSPPQQQNDSDCGIMTMKYIECLVLDHAVEDLNPEHCLIYRRSYWGQLFDYGKKSTAP